MRYPTDDLRIKEMREVLAPEELHATLPITEPAAETVYRTRSAIQSILHANDPRLLVVVGPCSIHDPKAAREYAERLAPLRRELAEDLEIVMRVYFEKPRTTVGWKGLINDPRLDGSFQINEGLRTARSLLLDLADMGLPAAVEYLDVISPQYVSDLVAWGAIGARTTESQVHRELASGLSCPVGFKNSTDGGVQIAIDAIRAAARPHHFLSVTKEGRSAIFATTGNPDGHLILRGGREPNYDAEHIESAARGLAQAGLEPRLMVDLSHANSRKKHELQLEVGSDVARQIAAGQDHIMGVMIESHLVGGRQDVSADTDLVYGQSITDACLAWDDTVPLLQELAQATRARREQATEAAAG
jgi:3-deoxy-7-phosphoheptulonate synthase